jgi:hypothetical protein
MSGPLPEEEKAIGRRRALYHLPADTPYCGLALSGGGIRSATFSLGLLRGLGSLELLQRIDYLSTVSGGGYAGAFYCGLFAPRAGQKAVVDPMPDCDLLDQEGAGKALGYLRQSGRYLTPAGGRDFVYALAILGRNWLALTLVCGMAILLTELVLDFFRHKLFVLAAHVVAPDMLPRLLEYYWVSPLALVIPILLLCLISSGWAYWLTMSDVTYPKFRPPLLGTILIFIVGYGVAFESVVPSWPIRMEQWIAAFVALLALKALLDWMVAGLFEKRRTGDGVGAHAAPGGNREAMFQNRMRHSLSTWQGYVAQVLLLVIVIALMDSATFLFASFVAIDPKSLGLTPLVGMAVPAARWLVKRLAAVPRGLVSAGGKPGMIARFGPLLAWLAALVFIIAALALWGAIAHNLVWDLATFPPKTAPTLQPSYHWFLIGSAVFVLFASFTQGFVNLSSLASFYAGRLSRAYLGAGNRSRIGMTGEAKAVHQSDPHDDIGLWSYYHEQQGAPVHLINVTINETHGKGPATVQRDRHGLNMVISPDGMSYSEVAPSPAVLKALDSEDMDAAGAPPHGKDNPGQSLPLSTWIGISGAAFTTGLGSATSLAKSVLAFLANVRLGYWWKADRTVKRATPTYLNFYRELVASFPGTDALQWYLSDGGHFENTAVYELVRRNVPFIILSDNGCDPKYGFEDIANLVRKCRIDFGAGIHFLTVKELDELLCCDDDLRGLFAGLGQFSDPEGPRGAVATLAQIHYANGTVGTLLVVKPRLRTDGPADLVRYLSDNPEFPQQSTLDQFFDEAQWESYYELGRTIAHRIFRRRALDGNDWQPHQLAPLSQT